MIANKKQKYKNKLKLYEVDEEEEVNHWENKPNNYGVKTVHNKDSLQKDRSRAKGVFRWIIVEMHCILNLSHKYTLSFKNFYQKILLNPSSKNIPHTLNQ